MELPNYIPTPQLSYELPTRRCTHYHRNHSQPCVSHANHETRTMSEREALTAQSPLFRSTPCGRLSAAQTRLGGRGAHCKRATAPEADAPVCACHTRRLRAPATRNLAQPPGLGEGVALQSGAQGSAAGCGWSALREASISKEDTSCLR